MSPRQLHSFFSLEKSPFELLAQWLLDQWACRSHRGWLWVGHLYCSGHCFVLRAGGVPLAALHLRARARRPWKIHLQTYTVPTFPHEP